MNEDTPSGAGAPSPRDDAVSTRIHGVIPCAGRSTRMGRSKALLDAGGRPFLARVVGTLREGGCRDVTVVVRDTAGAEAELARALDARVLANPDPSPGPIASVRVALRQMLDGDGGSTGQSGTTPPTGLRGIALLPVDHPLVSSETVARLLTAAGAGGQDTAIVLPRHGDRRGHPALFLEPVWGELLDPSLEGGARTVVRRDPERVLEVPVDDPGVLADIDDPEAYRRHLPRGRGLPAGNRQPQAGGDHG